MKAPRVCEDSGELQQKRDAARRRRVDLFRKRDSGSKELRTTTVGRRGGEHRKSGEEQLRCAPPRGTMALRRGWDYFTPRKSSWERRKAS